MSFLLKASVAIFLLARIRWGVTLLFVAWVATGAHAQEFAVPQVAVPQVAVPQVDAPQVDAPQVDAPQVAAPQVAAPQVAVPQVAVPQVDAPRPRQPVRRVPVHSAPLPPSERLVISFSKSTDRFGKTRQVLVFFGRVGDRGWEAIGNGDVSELQNHWRRAAARSFGDVRKLDLSAAESQKIDLAIEFTIAQFIRMYEGLQFELDAQVRDQDELSVDSRFKQLRELGSMGLFHEDSLAVRVANRITAQRPE